MATEEGQQGSLEDTVTQIYLTPTLQAQIYNPTTKETTTTQLTPTEHAFLNELLSNSGRVLSHDYLIDTVWEGEGDPSLVKKYAHRLRGKLGSEAIVSVHGEGYRTNLEQKLQPLIAQQPQLQAYLTPTQQVQIHNPTTEETTTTQLTPTEYRLLNILLTNSGATVDNSNLLDTIWGVGKGNSGLLKKYAQRLRGKLGKDAIFTVHNKGYRTDYQKATPEQISEDKTIETLVQMLQEGAFTNAEASVVGNLVRNHDTIVPYAQFSNTGNPNSWARFYMRIIRKKLPEDVAKHIITVRGRGYALLTEQPR